MHHLLCHAPPGPGRLDLDLQMEKLLSPGPNSPEPMTIGVLFLPLNLSLTAHHSTFGLPRRDARICIQQTMLLAEESFHVGNAQCWGSLLTICPFKTCQPSIPP